MTSRTAWLLVVLATLCLVAPYARAQTNVNPTGGMGLRYVSHGVEMVDGSAFDLFMTRVVGGTTSPAGAIVSETYRLPVGGAEIAATAARTLSAAEIAAAAAAVGGAAWVGFEIGSPIAKAFGWDTLFIGDTKCTATNNGWVCGIKQDSTPGATAAGFCYASSPSVCFASVSALAADFASHVTTGGSPAVVDSSSLSSGSVTVNYHYFDNPNGTGTRRDRSASFGETAGTVTAPASCPASIDALNPAWDVPAGSAPGADGKCPTGRYNAATNTQIATVIQGNLTAHPAIAPLLTTDVLAKGQPIATSSPRTLSGPSTAPLPGGTVVGPTGTTTTISNVTYNYAGDTITYNYNNTTAPVDPSASSPGTTTDKKPDDVTLCDTYPDVVACAKLGDPGKDAPTWSQVPVNWVAEDFGFGASCPSAPTLSFLGQTIIIKDSAGLAPMCAYAPAFAAMLNVLTAAFCSFLIVSQTTKT